LKLILDHNIDWRLKKHLIGHDVKTVQELGWSDVMNGELLTLIEDAGFQVFLTADSNIKKQQNMDGRKIGIVVLRVHNNRLATHRVMVNEMFSAINSIEPANVIEIFHQDFNR